MQPLDDLRTETGSSNGEVRVCPSCGHVNPSDGSTRCNGCWLPLTGVGAVSQMEGELMIRRRRNKLLGRKLVLRSLPLGLAVVLIVWGMVVTFDLRPKPAQAVSGLNPSVAAENWALARRTPDNSGFTPSVAPVPQQVQWTFATTETLTSAPAVVDGRVYLSTGGGRTVALDQASGQLLWEYHTGLSSDSTPAVAGDMVIAAFTPGLIVALDRNTGATRWKIDLDQPIFSSPILAEGTLYFGAGDWKLHALDAATGKERWVFVTEDWIVSPVAYADGTVVVASQDSHVYLLDADSGRQRLMFDTGFQRFGGGPAIHGDTVYFSSDRGWLWAIDRRAKSYPGQRKLWRVKINLYVWQVISSRPNQPGGLWSKRVGGELQGLLAIANDTVYGATEQGKVFARDAITGNKRWSTRLSVEISTAPTVAGNTVLVGSENGTIFGLDARTGDVLWDFNVSHEEIVDSPIVAGNIIYVVSADGTLYALSGAQ